MNKARGSITIYLSIVMVSVILLVSVVAEAARMSTVQSKCRAITYMATDSVMAGYGRQLLDDYGLLLAWENVPVEDKLNEYMQANINLADVKGQGSNLMNTNIVQIEKCDVGYVTTENGKLFVEQVNSYIKHTGSLEIAKKLINKFSAYSEGNESEENMEENTINIVEEDSEELKKIVEDAEEIILDLKDVKALEEEFGAMTQSTDNLKSFKKAYKNLKKHLKDKKKDVEDAIELLEQYEEKKEEFLEVNGYTTGVNDYMSTNLDTLEIIKDMLEEVEELKISQLSKVDANKEELMAEAVSKSSTVIKQLKELKIAEITEEDEENKSLYESAMSLINKGIISLVTENTTSISQNAISDENLPSELVIEEQSEENIGNKANLLVYSNLKFGNFLECKENTALKYEIEYLLNGKTSDSDNLAGTVKQLVLARNGINLLVLFSDKSKMAQISAISASAATAMSMPFMEIIIKAVLMEAWALAESVYEVKVLLKGWKVPMVKTKDKWKTEITNLFIEPSEKNHRKGLDYLTYCNILLLLKSTETIAYRCMDLIQLNIQKRYNSEFLMNNCFTQVEVKVDFQTVPIFVSAPWTLGEGGYIFSIEGNSSY